MNAHRSSDLDALAAFLASLRAPHRPPPPSEAAQNGATIFTRAGCASCHPAPLYTDRAKHDVGTGTSLEAKGTSFDTPSLGGLYDTAPYFHDGSAASLDDVLQRHAPAVDASERNDLVAFLRSLPFLDARRRAGPVS